MDGMRRTAQTIIMKYPATALDAKSVQDFMRQARPILTAGARIVIDLSGVERVETSGIRMLFFILKQVNAAGGELKLCNLNRRVQVFFEIVRLHRVFEICATKEEALRAFQ